MSGAGVHIDWRPSCREIHGEIAARFSIAVVARSELRKSGGTQPSKLGGSNHRQFCTKPRRRYRKPLVALGVPQPGFWHPTF
jgi:hypothetical protein